MENSAKLGCAGKVAGKAASKNKPAAVVSKLRRF
jgi:hypothetical protein